jgi:hypothetical protein
MTQLSLVSLKFGILKNLASVRHQHKYNLLGKSNEQGDLERQLGIKFEPQQRHMADVAFQELEAADLIQPTYDDLISSISRFRDRPVHEG